MARIRIERTTDVHDCETCGYSIADGAKIYVNDLLKAELVPSAYCYDGDSYDDDEIDLEVLKALDVNVVYSTEPGFFRRVILSMGHELVIE